MNGVADACSCSLGSFMHYYVANSFVILALLQTCIRSTLAPAPNLVLWEEGDDKYQTFVVAISHNGTCQPECTEDRILMLPPDVKYNVTVEIALIDMRSAAEQVEVGLGGLRLSCNPTPSSDHNCSLAFCAQRTVGPFGEFGLPVRGRGVQTRDTCKCEIAADGDANCYSEMLSGLDQTYGLLMKLTLVPDVEVKWVTGPWEPCDSSNCASISKRTTQCFISNTGSQDDVEVLLGSSSWYRCADSAPNFERKCSETSSCIAGPVSTTPCHFQSEVFKGLCCPSGLCRTDDTPVSCSTGVCELGGFAMLQKGRCESIGCSAIKDRSQCEDAAHAFGLVDSIGDRPFAALLITSYVPSFCIWEPRTINNDATALWLNMQETIVRSTEEFQQICQCRRITEARPYSWKLGNWSECSLTCGQQHRVRNVTCLKSVGSSTVDVSLVECLEADLSLPLIKEPCVTPVCYTSEINVKCGGKARAVVASDLGPKVAQSRSASASHCVELLFSASPERYSDFCRHSCNDMGDCVGFTLYEGPRTSQCCFLQQASYWDMNFRHAVCHLAHGIRAHNSCTCQVGWTYEGLAGEKATCGPEHGGCCITADSNMMPTCPTTCRQQQEKWNLCDPPGIAVLTENTCLTHSRLAEQECTTANSLSRCSQVASSLGLLTIAPTYIFSEDVPSACVYGKDSSNLLFNGAVTVLDDAGNVVAVRATPDQMQFCTCVVHVFVWNVSDWSPSFRDPSTLCGARMRSRHVLCLKKQARYDTDGGVPVSDSFCVSGVRPSEVESFMGCSSDVVRADVEFSLLGADRTNLNRGSLEDASRKDFALAMNIPAERILVRSPNCCEIPPVHVDLFVSGSSLVEAGDGIERLLRILRSPHDRARFPWLALIKNLTEDVSLTILGVYRWVIAGDWSPCSVQCGGGRRYRQVNCTFQSYNGLPTEYSDESNCDAYTKPQQVQVCSERSCESCPAFDLGPHYDVSGMEQQMVHGSKVYVTCAAGFSTVDDVALVASSCNDGRWTPLALSCGSDCPPYNATPWKYEARGFELLHGATRHVRCVNQAYSANIELPPSATIMCNDGNWTQPMLACNGDCQALELGNAYVMNGSEGASYASDGTSRNISCSPGFTSFNQHGEVAHFGELRCSQGTWIGREQLPVCKANCPCYQLLEGYTDYEGGSVVQNSRQCPPAGVSHMTSVTIRCAHDYGHVHGAMEHVKCMNGQWSQLSLVCRKNCAPFNVSNLDPRFHVDLSKTSKDILSTFGCPWNCVLHGSSVKITCAKMVNHVVSGAAWSISISSYAAILCDNGVWQEPPLECFHDCSPYAGGSQYATRAVDPSGNTRSHGAVMIVTCARKHSQFLNLSSPAPPIDETVCMDGAWTPLKLQCTPDCAPLNLGSEFLVEGIGFKFGARRNVSCIFRNESKVSVVCSDRGVWMVGERGKMLLHEIFMLSEKFDERSLGCLGREEGSNAWLLLSLLIIGFSLCLCCFVGTCWAARYHSRRAKNRRVSTQNAVGETNVRVDEDACAEADATSWSVWHSRTQTDDDLRTYDPTGPREYLENILTRFPTMNTSGRVSFCRNDSAGDSERKSAYCLMDSCGRPATHMCFPCNHVVLCVICASDLMEESAKGAATRCPACREFVTCAIDARPAPVFSSSWRLPQWIRLPHWGRSSS